MNKLDRITTDPEVFQGEPCVRGLRIPVSLIIKLISAGKTLEDILKDYPELENEDIKQSLEFAAWVVSEKAYPHFTVATEILDKLSGKWQQRWPRLANWLAKLQFSNWVPWNQRDAIDHANKSGVYILAIYDEIEEISPSIDPLDKSVIYVGKTNVGKTTSLKKRLADFDRAAFGNGASHAGGYTYREHFGTSRRGLYVSACPVYCVDERKKLVVNNKTHFDASESGDIQSFVMSQVITELEVCLRGLYVLKWGRLPKCNKE